MKIALTVWNGRISPLFDAARELLIAEIEDKEVTNRRHEPIEPQSLLRVVERLVHERVRILVCGAISEIPAEMIEFAGIELLAFVAGPMEEILTALAKRCSLFPQFSMPGCGCSKCPRPKGRKKGGLSGCSGSQFQPLNDGSIYKWTTK